MSAEITSTRVEATFLVVFDPPLPVQNYSGKDGFMASARFTWERGTWRANAARSYTLRKDGQRSEGGFTPRLDHEREEFFFAHVAELRDTLDSARVAALRSAAERLS